MTQRATATSPERPARFGSRAYGVCQALGWGTYLVLTLVQTAADVGVRTGQSAEVVFAACFGVVLTHRFRGFIRSREWLALALRALVPRALVAPCVLAVVFLTPLVLIERFALGEHRGSFPLVALSAWTRWTIAFFVWEAMYLGVGLVRSQRRAEADRLRLSAALQAAQLRSLQSQLNPHFLFNALNTVRALIAEDPARAQTAVTQVASILRHALGSRDQHLVTLESEIGVMDDYLAVESLRLGDRLRVERDIEAEAARAMIPALLLQALVENAVKHGIAELRDGGTLRICARASEGAMLLTVDNPRPPDAGPPRSPRSDETSHGIGLDNGKERLRLLFGDAASLELDLSTPGRATARLRVPMRP